MNHQAQENSASASTETTMFYCLNVTKANTRFSPEQIEILNALYYKHQNFTSWTPELLHDIKVTAEKTRLQERQVTVYYKNKSHRERKLKKLGKNRPSEKFCSSQKKLQNDSGAYVEDSSYSECISDVSTDEMSNTPENRVLINLNALGQADDASPIKHTSPQSKKSLLREGRKNNYFKWSPKLKELMKEGIKTLFHMKVPVTASKLLSYMKSQARLRGLNSVINVKALNRIRVNSQLHKMRLKEWKMFLEHQFTKSNSTSSCSKLSKASDSPLPIDPIKRITECSTSEFDSQSISEEFPQLNSQDNMLAQSEQLPNLFNNITVNIGVQSNLHTYPTILIPLVAGQTLCSSSPLISPLTFLSNQVASLRNPQGFYGHSTTLPVSKTTDQYLLEQIYNRAELSQYAKMTGQHNCASTQFIRSS